MFFMYVDILFIMLSIGVTCMSFCFPNQTPFIRVLIGVVGLGMVYMSTVVFVWYNSLVHLGVTGWFMVAVAYVISGPLFIMAVNKFINPRTRIKDVFSTKADYIFALTIGAMCLPVLMLILFDEPKEQ